MSLWVIWSFVELVLHRTSAYQTQTAPNYFYNKTRVRGVESNYRTIIKNLELFLKTRIFFEKKNIKYLKIRIILCHFSKKILVFKNSTIVRYVKCSQWILNKKFEFGTVRFGNSTKVREDHCISFLLISSSYLYFSIKS